MADTTPKMSLRRWDQLSDPFSHDQLGDNWLKIDFHDHTPGRGVQIPTEGLADGAVTSAKLASALDPSAAYTTYKTLHNASGNVGASTAIGSVFMISRGVGIVSVGSSSSAMQALYLNPADFNVSGRTTYFRVRFATITNAVAPAATFTGALQPVATWGGGSGVNPNIASLGAQVTGSTAAIVAPAATTAATPVVSTDFALTAGWYVLTVTTSVAITTAGSQTLCYIELQYRQV